MKQPIKYLYHHLRYLFFKKKLWLEDTNMNKNGKMNLKPYNSFYHKNVLDVEQANLAISNYINSGESFLVARIGACENSVMKIFDFDFKSKKEKMAVQLCTCAGFFPNNFVLIEKFSKLMKESLEDVDFLGLFKNNFEDYYISSCCKKDLIVSPFPCLYPYYSVSNPWTKALQGKKVLVVHPFESTIKHQYKIIDKIWGEYELMPKFDLLTVKAIQTIAGNKDERFNTWFDALDYMYSECMKLDFDVAIIGCGAYGLPLSAKLKKSGKSCIHLGGITQILFGIRGKRWDESYTFLEKYYNEYWVYPFDEDRPKGLECVENGCYW